MKRRALRWLMVAAALSLAACGVKNELETPSGHKTPDGQTNPSTPPKPIGK